MCGRYGRRGDKQKIADAFHVETSLEDIQFAESQNCAPGSFQPVVSLNDEGERELSLMRWGFQLPDRFLINVKADTVLASRFWKDKFAERRCIVPASSYFEWQDCDSKPKPKYEINLPGREYMGLAAIWAPWKNPKTEQWEKTFSTFTIEPNALIRRIHSRQAVILEPRDYEPWLAVSERPPTHLLRTMPAKEMQMQLLGEAVLQKAPEPPAQRDLFG
jgi:putative SOS response-associated peptidase YedK